MNRTSLLAVTAAVASASVVFGVLFLPHEVKPLDPAQAVAIAEAGCNAAKPDPEACARAGSMRLYSRDADGARTRAAKGLGVDPSNLHLLMLDAAISSFMGQAAEAREKYLAAEKAHPESGLPSANLALLALSTGDVPLADEAAERAVKADPSLSLAHHARARVLVAKGDDDAAIRELDIAVAKDRDAIDPRLEMADIFARQQKFDERLIVMKDVAKSAPRDVGVRVGLGQSYEMVGDLANAATELRAAAELAPDDPRVDLALGRVYLEERKPEFALARLRSAHEKMPARLEPKLLLASALGQTGARDEALALLDEVIGEKGADAPSILRARRQRSALYVELGRDDDALADVGAWLEADPSDGAMHERAAHILIDLKRYPEAAAHLEAARAAGSNTYAARLDQARVLAQLGKKEDAIGALESLSTSPEWNIQQVRAQSEFAPLLEEMRFRLLLEKQ